MTTLEDKREEAEEYFASSFLKPEIVENVFIHEYEDEYGSTYWIEAGYFEEDMGQIVRSFNPGERVLGRMSAPGYLDCTDWVAYKDEISALSDLILNYGDI